MQVEDAWGRLWSHGVAFRILAWVPVTSVALMCLAMYSSWFAAYKQLGWRPRPNVDDPNAIGGFSTDLYEFCLPLVLALFGVWLIASALTCMIGDSPEVKVERQSKWLVTLTAGLIVIGPFAFLFLLFASPGGAVGWFFD